jgi:lipoprotein-anchoring transpeptidase ErfK/SrfK
LVAVVAAAGVGAGAYVGVPYALAGEQRQSPDRFTVSTSPTDSPSRSESISPPSIPSAPPPSPAAPTPAPTTPAAKPTTKPKPPTGPCYTTGPTQLVVERYLAAHREFGKVTVDGKQSLADCAAIKKFQSRYGVRPVAGLAGPVSGRVATRLTNAAVKKCDATGAMTVCVDLTSQTMWVVRSGAVVLGPTPIRTGRAGLATPPGRYHIGGKKRYTISTIYKVPLPYWQQFHADMGFHQTPSYLYEGDSPGSHGCINVLRRDAARLYELTDLGTPVHIFGRKPGT